MRQDKPVKFLLALIAAGLWAVAFALAQLSVVPAHAGSEDRATEVVPAEAGNEVSREPWELAAQGLDSLDIESRAITPGPATLPLRWHVSFAAEETGSFITYCGTAVHVNNPTSSSVTTQVEWFQYQGASLGHTQATVPANSSYNFWGDDEVLAYPFVHGVVADLPDFDGHARVHADDPRIMVSAHLICRDGTGLAANLLAITPIVVFPVGATMDYFQAGMPAMPLAPAVAVPEEPLSRDMSDVGALLG